MKYNTKEIKVKEIINLIGNLEADGYRGENWNPSNVFDWPIHRCHILKSLLSKRKLKKAAKPCYAIVNLILGPW